MGNDPTGPTFIESSLWQTWNAYYNPPGNEVSGFHEGTDV